MASDPRPEDLLVAYQPQSTYAGIHSRHEGGRHRWTESAPNFSGESEPTAGAHLFEAAFGRWIFPRRSASGESTSHGFGSSCVLRLWHGGSHYSPTAVTDEIGRASC